jgi:hypothetical protein
MISTVPDRLRDDLILRSLEGADEDLTVCGTWSFVDAECAQAVEGNERASATSAEGVQQDGDDGLGEGERCSS